MSIADMRRYARLREQGAATIEPRLRLLEDHGANVRARIARLNAHEEALARKISTYRESLTARGSEQKAGAEQ